MENASWLLGRGSMNFWCKSWMGFNIAESINIPTQDRPLIKAYINDFWINGNWNFPSFLTDNFQQVINLIL